ncbi:uncharacterized protein LOC114718114 isoform X2 [Neltuma alba]|nr:uncharacterized protein LOC114718114 isoform X2 [Prosopis alba]XP_028759206.1 uncharacterized protein LOC114718114 isoform X2 [Prosopis alba]
MRKRKASHTWRSIYRVWEQFLKGVGRKINNGKNTSFWWEYWHPLDRPLIDFVYPTLSINSQDKVCNHLFPCGRWNVEYWRTIFPEWVTHILSKIPPPNCPREDCFMWQNGKEDFMLVHCRVGSDGMLLITQAVGTLTTILGRESSVQPAGYSGQHDANVFGGRTSSPREMLHRC